MKLKKIVCTFIVLNLLNMAVLPTFAITENSNAGISKKQEKMLKHKTKRSKKYNDDYKYAYVNLDFWKGFNDENLNNYINLAIKNNYDLKLATLNVDEYYQNVKLQLSQELPQIMAGYAPAYTKLSISDSKSVIPSGWTQAIPVLINYEADIFLKNRDKTKSVKKLYEASQFDERAAYISVASAVGGVYINLCALNEIIKHQEDIVNLRKEIYEIMLESNKQGLVSTSDTVKANKAYVYGNSELINYKKEQAKLLHQLAVLVGESPENIDKLKITEFSKLSYSKQIPSEVQSEVITNRPDYLKAFKMLEKSGIDVRIAKKEFLPTITISGLATFFSVTSGHMDSLYAAAASGLLPVFTGGKRIANLKLKKVQYDKALENYYKTNLTAMQEINDALISIKRDSEKLDEHKKQLALESQDFSYTKQRYNQGIISKLDLIQMQENLLTVNQLLTNSKGNCYIDYISLYKATGAKL
ncbi:TolC family protein [bacterium]|nr:TolC family protein [bacterium]